MLQLTRKKKQKDGGVVGLDIEAGSVAAAELSGSNGSARVATAAIEPLPAGAFQEGEVVDGDLLAESLKSLFSAHRLSKRVRLGIANQRVIVRTLRLPAIESPKEMEAAVRFQAQEQIPMPLDQAVLEHQVVGGVAAEEGATPQVDVVVIAARRDMVASFVEPIRRAGLEPVGVDLSAFGMIRALAGVAEAEPAAAGDGNGEPQAAEPAPRAQEAVLYCNVGDVMNLAVARGRACLFTRVSNVGLAEGASGMTDELRLSLDYYRAQESAVPVTRVVLCGPGSTVPDLGAQMEEGLGLPIAASRPAALEGHDEAAAARLTLPYGLALES